VRHEKSDCRSGPRGRVHVSNACCKVSVCLCKRLGLSLHMVMPLERRPRVAADY
jgi:hypothetical protein